MTTVMVPEFALSAAQGIVRDVESEQIAQFDSEAICLAKDICILVQAKMRTAIAGVEQALDTGIDETELRQLRLQFGALPAIRKVLERLAEMDGGESSGAPTMVSFTMAFTGMVRELLAMASLMEKLIAKDASVRPIDWNKVAEVQAAHARGETAPFRWQDKDAATN